MIRTAFPIVLASLAISSAALAEEAAPEAPTEALGAEAEPVRQIPPPVLVTRNSIVKMEFKLGRLSILTEGRALSQGRLGDIVKVMNLSSKNVVTGTVASESRVVIQ